MGSRKSVKKLPISKKLKSINYQNPILVGIILLLSIVLVVQITQNPQNQKTISFACPVCPSSSKNPADVSSLMSSLSALFQKPKTITLSTTESPVLFHVDGRPVLFYEIYVSNLSDMQPSKLEVLNEKNQVISSISGDALNQTLMPPHNGVLQTTVRIWVELGNLTVPANISHRLSFANSSLVVDGASMPVIVKPLPVIQPPLRPNNWWSANGPSNLNVHRSAIFEIIGNRYLPERYAIDWVVGGANHSTHTGNGTSNSDYYAYGQDLLAVANGTIVGVWDGVPVAPKMPDERWMSLSKLMHTG